MDSLVALLFGYHLHSSSSRTSGTNRRRSRLFTSALPTLATRVGWTSCVWEAVTRFAVPSSRASTAAKWSFPASRRHTLSQLIAGSQFFFHTTFTQRRRLCANRSLSFLRWFLSYSLALTRKKGVLDFRFLKQLR